MQRLYVLVVALSQLALPLFFFFMAIGKLMAWEEFEASLDTYTLVPVPVRMLAAVLVPAGEAAAFVLYLLRLRVWANVLCAGMLVLFVVVTYWHWRLNVPPECACMGLWAQYWQMDDSAMAVMLRDGYMLGYIAVVLAVTRVDLWIRRNARGSENAKTCEDGCLHVD